MLCKKNDVPFLQHRGGPHIPSSTLAYGECVPYPPVGSPFPNLHDYLAEQKLHMVYRRQSYAILRSTSESNDMYSLQHTTSGTGVCLDYPTTRIFRATGRGADRQTWPVFQKAPTVDVHILGNI